MAEVPDADQESTLNELAERGTLSVVIDGPAVHGHRIAIRDLATFVESLQVAVERVAQVLSGTSSTLQGRIPSPIRNACALDIIGVGEGSVTVEIGLSYTAQNPLFGTAGQDALEKLVNGIPIITANPGAHPEGFDDGVVAALKKWDKVLEHGVDRIDLSLKNGRSISATYSAETSAHLALWEPHVTTTPNVLSGLLMMGDFAAGSRKCRLEAFTGERITCRFDENLRNSVLAAITKPVRVVIQSEHVFGSKPTHHITEIEILDTASVDASAQQRPLFTELPSGNMEVAMLTPENIESNNPTPFGRLDALSTLDTGGEAVSSTTLTTARNVLRSLMALANRERLRWIDPHVSATPLGDATFEWWQGEKQLSIFVSGEEAEYIQAWGEGDVVEMDDGDATLVDNQRNYWKWLVA